MALPSKKREINSSQPKRILKPRNKNENSLKELNEEEIIEAINEEVKDQLPEIENIKSIPKNKDIVLQKESSLFIEEPNENNDFKNYNDEKFIDKENLKIVPIGKKVKKIRAEDFDNRKNSLTGLKIFRAFLYFIISVLFLLGIKNTFFPSNNYSKQEIEAIAENSVGITGFPTLKGQSFAENFIKYYLTLNQNDPNRIKILSEFYGGTDEKVLLSDNVDRSAFLDNKQTIIGEPRTFEIINATQNSSLYKISALVTDENGNTINGDNTTSHWISFAVNVYYDTKTKKLSIPEGNPYIIPTYEILNTAETPSPAPIGNGTQEKDEIYKEMFPTIAGYIKAFTKSSYSNHNDILQYIDENADADLYSGFNNTIQLVADDTEAIKPIIYKTDDENIWKVDVNITWQDTQSSNGTSGAIYTSRYVMTIIKSNKKYLITKFSPYVYVPE